MSRPQRRRSKNNSKNNSKSNRKPRAATDGFWSDGSYTPTEAEKISPTPEPDALPRSLGDPPLTPDTAAGHHLAVVYEEAVRAATALATANGLLAESPSEDEPA